MVQKFCRSLTDVYLLVALAAFMQKSARNSAIALLSIGLIACGGDYKISEPTKDSVHTAPPSNFTVTYKKQPSELPKMTLNGFDVQSHFVAGETSAIGDGANFQDYFIEVAGNNCCCRMFVG